MPQVQILIASVLKPVDDPRMYEKLGRSLSKINGFKVNIAGFKGKIPADPEIDFHPIFTFNRLSILRRMKADRQLQELLEKIKPELLIVETHELLHAALEYRHKTGCRVIYDIRENYLLTIQHGSAFPKWIRRAIAKWVRRREVKYSSQIDYFFLAEEVYRDQLEFVPENHLYLPNASRKTQFERTSERNPHQVIFSGTIAPETGIREAARFIKLLQEVDPSYFLKVVGYCHNPHFFKQIRQEYAGNTHIIFPEENTLVPHQEILDEINRSSVGFIHYEDLPQFRGKIPTKLFEYAAAGLRICISNSEVISIPEGIPNTEPIDLNNWGGTLSLTNSIAELPSALFWEYYEEQLAKILTSLK